MLRPPSDISDLLSLHTFESAAELLSLYPTDRGLPVLDGFLDMQEMLGQGTVGREG